MSRIKVKILKTCVLGQEGNEMNILKSQLPRFEGMCEIVDEEVITGNVNNLTNKEIADLVLDHEKENMKKSGSDKIDENINLGEVKKKSKDKSKKKKRGLFGFGK